MRYCRVTSEGYGGLAGLDGFGCDDVAPPETSTGVTSGVPTIAAVAVVWGASGVEGARRVRGSELAGAEPISDSLYSAPPPEPADPERRFRLLSLDSGERGPFVLGAAIRRRARLAAPDQLERQALKPSMQPIRLPRFSLQRLPHFTPRAHGAKADS